MNLRANSSFPVPVSPRSSTVAAVGATWLALSSACRSVVLAPTSMDDPLSVVARRIVVVLELLAEVLDLGLIGHGRSNRGACLVRCSALPMAPARRRARSSAGACHSPHRWKLPTTTAHALRSLILIGTASIDDTPLRLGVLPLGERLHRQFLATADVHDLVVQEAHEPSPACWFDAGKASLESRPLTRVRRLNRPVLVEFDERAVIGVHREADLLERMIERGLELFQRHRRQPRRQARQQALEPQPIVAGGGSW